MERYFKAIDEFSLRFTDGVIRYRWTVLLLAILVTVGLSRGVGWLEFAANYRTFLSADNPELSAYDDVQATATTTVTLLFVC